MKHTTTRKKMLLSSVAMLLVAMLALGSATFAWFTTNPNAEASGLQMKATASKGLVIKTASRAARQAEANWVHTDYLNSNAAGTGTDNSKVFELTPASFNSPANDFEYFYTVEAKADGNYIADNTADVSKSNTFGNWADCTTVYKEDINCKLTGTDDENVTSNLKLTGLEINLKKVEKTINNTKYDQSHGVRVALLYTDSDGAQSVVGVYNGTGADVSNKYLTGEGKYAAKLSQDNDSTAGVDESKYTASKVPTSPVTLGTVDTSGTCKVTVIVYLDGEDSNVFTDSISSSQFLNSIKVNLKVED